ncbi:Fumarate hydratase class II [uncultured archaeon]|nr:Fumarate hydratase class II [uncultured archaeon]
MSVHPIESRYGRPEVRRIFDEETKLDNILKVEAALVRAHAKVGNVPADAAKEVSKKASVKYVKLARVAKIEKEINHDVMAVVKALTEQCSGGAGRYVHLGATSNDVLDTATALQLKEYLDYLEDDVLRLKKSLLSQAKRRRNLVCVGRTHGQHAVPTTYGLKFAIWASEVGRHLERLRQLRPRLLVGKMSGAVGTQAALGECAVEIQELVMDDLGVKSALVSNQVVQRDRHAEFFLFLALVSQTLYKIALEIRNLQRTEIGEVAEGFGKNQVGSSTMPHKRNPILAERICGLARVVKADSFVALDNVPLWHERDLTNSSPERVILPEASILADYILNLTIDLVDGLVFNEKRIQENLNMEGGRIMAESVMIRLTQKGLGRQDAHELVRKLSMRSFKEGKPLKKYLVADKSVRKLLSVKEIDEAMKPENYVGTARQQVDKAVKELS